MKILFCEDITILRKLVPNVLKSIGHQVEIACDGQDALEKLQANTFDLLITDNRMPRLSGVQLVEKLRKWNVPIKVIMASEFHPPLDPEIEERLRLDGVLKKPYNANELLDCVKKLQF